LRAGHFQHHQLATYSPTIDRQLRFFFASVLFVSRTLITTTTTTTTLRKFLKEYPTKNTPL
jgi:hypothetical protein